MEKSAKILRHVAIIMDGNGRWAERNGLERVEGHVRGVESVREAISSAVRHGVGYLTLYVFSAENWGRPAGEVEALMELLCRCVVSETDELRAQGAKVKIIGDRRGMPAKVLEHIEIIERETASGTTISIQLALNYGGRQELAAAAKALAKAVAEGRMAVEEIDPEALARELYTAEIPDPDLVIRTGGDQRLSNFLLWQSAYAELYFTPEFWPEFGAASFDAAIGEYRSRERRYGLTSGQIDPGPECARGGK